MREAFGGKQVLPLSRKLAAMRTNSFAKGVIMNSKMRLSLLACALGAASIATAQTSNDASSPKDVIRSPGSVATPIMPVVVSPPPDDTGVGTAAENGNSRRALPLVRSIGSDTNASDETLSGDTMIDGAATGAVTPNSDGKAGVVDSGTKAFDNAGAETAPDASAVGASSGTGDTTGEAGDTMGNQNNKQNNELSKDENNQPGNSTTAPATRPDITRTDAGALGASSGGK
ncbi:MAG TPA: hypothetical protein VN989_03875 [Casimicrobiaceae bacterium]|nr:hypothetical protein [Casimicrobiaceae bacterium]